MVFTDGTPPSDAILKKFLRLCEQYIDCPEVKSTNNISESNVITKNKNVNGETNTTDNVGAVAVHCKGKNNPLYC